MIEAAIYSLLSGNTALAALVGTDADGDVKICPVIEKQGVTAPYIVFQISTVPRYFKNGVEANESTVIVYCYAKGYLACANIAAAARTALELKTGSYGNPASIIEEMYIENIEDDIYVDESEVINAKVITIKSIHN